MKMTETLEYYTPFFLLNENHINPVCRPFNSTITVLPTETNVTYATTTFYLLN